MLGKLALSNIKLSAAPEKVDINNNVADVKAAEPNSILSKIKKIMFEQEMKEQNANKSSEDASESVQEIDLNTKHNNLSNHKQDEYNKVKIEIFTETRQSFILNENNKTTNDNIKIHTQQNAKRVQIALNGNILDDYAKKSVEQIEKQDVTKKEHTTIPESNVRGENKQNEPKLDEQISKNEQTFNLITQNSNDVHSKTSLDVNNNDETNYNLNGKIANNKHEDCVQIETLDKNIKCDINSKVINDQTSQQPKVQSEKQFVRNYIPQKEKKNIELIIRASTIDGQRKGACLFCQEYFMDLYILSELNYINLKISTVDLKKPPKDFRNNFDCTPPPILLDRNEKEQRAILENEKIERYIMKNLPGGHLLFVRDSQTAKLIENLYSKFKLALSRNELHTKKSLLKHLEAINQHLEDRKTKYLTGDYVCCFDCELMTRLQHIRVAGAYFIKDFTIPSHLTYLWSYMGRMYSLNAFIQSCPADQDIISHYLNSSTILLNRNNMLKNKSHLELQTPCYSNSVPSN